MVHYMACLTAVMPKPGNASFRLSNDLKADLLKIAEIERRSLSNTIELLLGRAVRDYQANPIPLNMEPTTRQEFDPEKAIARRLDLDPEEPSPKKVAAKSTSKR